MSTTNNYQQYTEIMQQAADLNNAAALLAWDQEVYMPAKGATTRGRQIATLSAMAHDILTGDKLGQVLERLHSDSTLTINEKANVKLSTEDMERNKKLPTDFVAEISNQSSVCFTAWLEARKQNDFSLFAPALSKMIALKKQQAELVGYAQHPYDALLDEYEKGASVAMLEPVFESIQKELYPILQRIKEKPQVSDACLLQHFPKDAQWEFSLEVLKAMGYDFDAGRQDISEHPFTISFSADDVRVTTRVDENNFASLLWSSIHEGGHALYEQGLPTQQYGLPLGSACSLGIHESQSRLWENCVGRSLEFWEYFYPILQKKFPQQLGNVDVKTFFKAINQVAPSLIRTEADEITYHFHVLIRYKIEKMIFEGAVEVADLPSLWNSMYEQYLGVKPPTDKEGILQDVHWSHGSFGYFPTYSLGSFYAAQFWAVAQKSNPQLVAQVKAGQFYDLLQWLRTQVHAHGRKYTSEELCEKITGEKLNIQYFLDYVNKKYALVYE